MKGQGQIRIIGGQWKRTLISVPDREGLRPTPDRVRETLFNWLGQRVDEWRCLDLFAGSGALGFEAASRGAEAVIFVESSPVAARAIATLIGKLGAADRLQLIQTNAMDWLARQSANTPPFDLVFLDPPFGQNWLEQVMPRLSAILAPGGLVYVESDAPVSPDWAARFGLALVRADKAGLVHYHLLQAHDAALGEQHAEGGLSGNL
jgi:16S rRNA (guanine(966)-N(2))-methyltransferase RsmD